jgi:hypothetical protein
MLRRSIHIVSRCSEWAGQVPPVLEIEMAKTTDYSKMYKDMMGSFPVDMTAMQEAFKTSAAFGEKFSKLALEAAEKSNEISTKWTKDTLAKLALVSKVKDEPADYSKAFTDFASAEAEMLADTMAAYAEVAKKVQMESVELMLAAGKTASEDATAAMKKASADVSAAAKKVAVAAH